MKQSFRLSESEACLHEALKARVFTETVHHWKYMPKISHNILKKVKTGPLKMFGNYQIAHF